MGAIGREIELDVAFALERFPCVAEALAIDPPTTEAAIALGIRPYSMGLLVEVHYGLLAVTHHTTTGRVLYFDADHRPGWLGGRARAIRVPAGERAGVARRVEEQAASSARAQRQEQQAIDRAKMAGELGTLESKEGEWISASLQSGEWEVVRDPFPSDALPRSRVLVVDEEPEVSDPLRALGELEVIHACDGWEAVERLTSESFDLAICSVKLTGELNGRTIYKLVKGQAPRVAARIVLLADDRAIEALGPASSSERVMARPIDPDVVRSLLARWRSAF